MTSEEAPLLKLRLFRRTQALFNLAELWEASLPGLDRGKIESTLSSFAEEGATSGELAAMLDRADLMETPEKKDLNRMIQRGLAPEQINLFIQSTPIERSLLTEEWRTDLAAKLQRAAPHASQSIGTATSAGLVGGALGCLAFMSMTLMVQDASFFESGKALLGAMVSPEVGLGSRGIQVPSMDRIVETGATVSMGATLATLLLKTSLTLVSELFKPPPQQVLDRARMELENKAKGAFFTHGQQPLPLVGRTASPERCLQALKDIPDSILPVLTHLQPKELVSFLEANDATRETMLRTHPPTMDQRIDAVRACHPSKMGRAWGSARQSLSAWEGWLSNSCTVSLKSSLAAMRGARDAKMGLLQPSPSTQRPAMG